MQHSSSSDLLLAVTRKATSFSSGGKAFDFAKHIVILTVSLRHKDSLPDRHAETFPLPEYEEGQQLSKLADESLVPYGECLEDEILQFAERFLEWALINQLLFESDDPESLDLYQKVLQTRENGLKEEEKINILKVSR